MTNGDLEEIRMSLARLETSLGDHKEAFDKHESRDDARFKALTTECQEIRNAITAVQMRQARIFGVAAAIIVVAQFLFNKYG